MVIEILKALLTSFLGTLGFCVIFHAPKRSLLPAALSGAMTYLVYFLCVKWGLSATMANLIAAAIGSILAQLAARKTKIIATVFLIASVIPLVPGLGLYECMAMLATGAAATALKMGLDTMKIVLMLALGISVGTFVFGTGQKKPKEA